MLWVLFDFTKKSFFPAILILMPLSCFAEDKKENKMSFDYKSHSDAFFKKQSIHPVAIGRAFCGSALGC